MRGCAVLRVLLMSTQALADRLLSEAIDRIESRSIRAWARSAQNAPIWLKVAETWIAGGKADPSNPDTVVRFSTYIVCVAMG